MQLKPTQSTLHSAATTGNALAFLTGFYFCARIVITLVSVHVLGTEARTGSATSLILNFLLLALIWFCTLGANTRSLAPILKLPSIRWIALFLVVSCASLTWGSSVSPATSFAYWCGMVADVAIMLLLLRSGAIAQTAQAMMKGFLWATCLLSILVWIMPTQSDLRLGDQDYFNTNQIANLCAFSIFLAQYLIRRKDGRWGWMIFFLIVTLLRSLSKTTYIAFLLSESFLLIQDRAMSRRTKILLTTAAILAILIFWGLFEAYYDVYTNAGSQAETLTGRTGIWAHMLNEAVQQPWIGHGFDGVWKVIPPFGSDRFEPRHAENELFQQFYAYGVLGIVMLIGLYGSLYRQLRKAAQAQHKVIFTSLLIYIVVRGFAVADSFEFLLPLWAIILIGTLVESEATSASETAILAAPSTRIDPSVSPQRA